MIIIFDTPNIESIATSTLC